MSNEIKNRGKLSLLSATIWVSLLLVIGKFLGFAREALIAAFFGATGETDAFFLAHSMPAMLFPAVCNSFSIGFTSFYVEKLAIDEENGDEYGSRMLKVTFIIGVILAILGVVLSPIIVPLFAPGFSGNQLVLAIRLTRLTMGAFCLTMLCYMLTAILNSKKFFIGAQVAALNNNIIIVLILVMLGKNQSMDFLTITVIIGLIVQVFTLIICCKKIFTFRWRISPFHNDSMKLIRLTAPILLGNCVTQINSIVDKMLSSTLGDGALSALSYSTSLYTVVVSVFITSLSTVLYPSLIDDCANKNNVKFSKDLNSSLSGLSFILIWISIVTVLDAQNIVEVVYGRGSFNQEAVKLTSQALCCFGPCFVFYGIRETLNKAFYAVKDTKTPMINSIIGVAANISISVVLVKYIGISGIALGTTMSALISSLLLIRSIKKKMNTVKFKFKSMIVQLICGISVFCGCIIFRYYIDIKSPFIELLLHSFVSAVCYFIILILLGDKNALLMIERGKHKMQKIICRMKNRKS